MKTGKFGGTAVEYEGPNSPFLAWEIGKARVDGRVFPVTATTGMKGSEQAAVYNLQHGGYPGALAYVSRNIARAVVVDNARSGVEYSLDIEVKAFGFEKGLTLNLSQKSPRHNRLNLRAAVRTFAATIISTLANGYYLSLREAGWKPASETEAPEALVEGDDSAF